MIATGVIIPYCPTDKHRGQALEYVRTWWETTGAAVVVSHLNSPSRWCKGEALKAGTAVLDAEIYILADADCLPTVEGVSAVLTAIKEGRSQWGTPHTDVHRLDEAATATLYYEGKAGDGRTIAPYPGVVGGGVTILTKEALRVSGGVDPRFVGWGGEDIAFGWALETLCGIGSRSAEPLLHLWHPVQGPRLPVSRENQKILARYRRAKGRPERMRELVESVG